MYTYIIKYVYLIVCIYIYIYILHIDTLWGLQYETMAITGCKELCSTTAHSGTRRACHMLGDQVAKVDSLLACGDS